MLKRHSFVIHGESLSVGIHSDWQNAKAGIDNFAFSFSRSDESLNTLFLIYSALLARSCFLRFHEVANMFGK